MHHYIRLLTMTVLSFISMYVFMYSMVDIFDNVYPNLNQLYMAALMTAPMVLIEIAVMQAMYKNQKANIAIAVAGIVTLAGCFLMIRQQTAIADSQFLKSMIPHHAGAILMCEKAPIADAEVRKLCRSIIDSQRREIADMKVILGRLEK